MASVELVSHCQVRTIGHRKRGLHLIHCGSSVTTSPGVMIALRSVLLRFGSCVASMSPSESTGVSEDGEPSLVTRGGAAGGRMMKVIAELCLTKSQRSHDFRRNDMADPEGPDPNVRLHGKGISTRGLAAWGAGSAGYHRGKEWLDLLLRNC